MASFPGDQPWTEREKIHLLVEIVASSGRGVDELLRHIDINSVHWEDLIPPPGRSIRSCRNALDELRANRPVPTTNAPMSSRMAEKRPQTEVMGQDPRKYARLLPAPMNSPGPSTMSQLPAQSSRSTASGEQVPKKRGRPPRTRGTSRPAQRTLAAKPAPPAATATPDSTSGAETGTVSAPGGAPFSPEGRPPSTSYSMDRPSPSIPPLQQEQRSRPRTPAERRSTPLPSPHMGSNRMAFSQILLPEDPTEQPRREQASPPPSAGSASGAAATTSSGKRRRRGGHGARSDQQRGEDSRSSGSSPHSLPPTTSVFRPVTTQADMTAWRRMELMSSAHSGHRREGDEPPPARPPTSASQTEEQAPFARASPAYAGSSRKDSQQQPQPPQPPTSSAPGY